MAKYFKIATAQVRALGYKNCYDWAMVRYNTETGKCYFRVCNKLNVFSLSEVIALHKNVTSQKPYAIKPVQVAEFWGLELAVIDFADENSLSSQLLNNEFYNSVRLLEKKWPGNILKNVNNLLFIK